MTTFFSGTDIDTLKKEGSDRNNFVSLIVNNAGVYNAAITWKELIQATPKKTWFGSFIQGNEVEDIEEVVYSFMTIERETDDYIDEELDTIIDELKKEKSRSTTKFDYSKLFDSSSSKSDKYSFPTAQSYKPEVSLNTITEEKELEIPFNIKELDESYSTEYTKIIPQNIVDSTAAQLLTGSLTAIKIPENNLNDIIKTIKERFEKRFNDIEEINSFSAIEYALGNYVPSVIDTMVGKFDKEEDDTVKASALALEVISILEPFVDKLPHISIIISELENYLRI